MRRTLRLLLVVSLPLVAMTASSRACANDDGAGEQTIALDLFEQGRALLREGKVDAALNKFEAAEKLLPTFGIMLNVAECHEKLGHTASAWSKWRQARAVASNADDEATAIERQHALEPSLSRLTIVVMPGADVPGLEIRRDDVVIPREAWGSETAIDPGSHIVEVRAPGKATRRIDVAVKPNGDRPSVSIDPLVAASTAISAPVPTTLAPVAPIGSPPARSSESPSEAAPTTLTSPASPHASSHATVGWIVGGAGVAIAAGFGILAAVEGTAANDKYAAEKSAPTSSTSNYGSANSAYANAQLLANAGFVGVAVGGAAIVTGAVLLLTGPAASEKGAIRVVPWMTGSSGGATVMGAW